MLTKLFSEYFRPTEDEYNDFWAKGIFVPDTNVLLGLYRYSRETADELLSCLDAVKDRLWFPHQVAKEFAKNRPAVITEQQAIFADYCQTLPRLCADACENLAKEVGKLVKKRDTHPVIRKDDIVQKIQELVDSHVKELGKCTLLSEESDSLLPRIEALMDGRIGPAFEPEQLEQIVKEGCIRLEAKNAPGWEDYQKNKDLPDKDRCGDWLIWKQILDYTKDKNFAALIFITADGKEDWWRKSHGRTLGPDPRLIAELQSHSGCRLILYDTEQFLNHSKASAEAITEVRELQDSRTIPLDHKAISPLNATLLRDELERLQKQENVCKLLTDLAAIVFIKEPTDQNEQLLESEKRKLKDTQDRINYINQELALLNEPPSTAPRA